MFIDTHCHFDFPPFIDNLAESINKIHQANISHIIVPSVSQAHFDVVINLAKSYPTIYAALGLHPIWQHKEQDIEQLEQYLNNPQNPIVAIGEVGLDAHIEQADLQLQTFFLQQQFALAKKYELPVILHSRKTHPLLLKLLKQAKLPQTGVLHGFSGSYEEAMQFIKLGYYIGVGGVITYERAQKTRHAISKIPLQSIVLETDAPDMPLSGMQGKPNRPENIVKIYETLTQLRAEPATEILKTVYANTLTLFSVINTMK
ncbi:TatD family hydrolase [Orbaceae bacterium ac157xtp]